MKISGLIKTYTPPVVIGGAGGSGTRLIAECLRQLDFYIGSDLNKANDNLWFTLLFKRIETLSATTEEINSLIEILFKGMTGSTRFTQVQIDLVNELASLDRKQHPTNWLKARAESLLSERPVCGTNDRWGWKAPNNHIIINHLIESFPNMKYIHVARNGLDMAYSKNQNQLELWGKHFLGLDVTLSPYYSLKYWCIIHRRILDYGATIGSNFLFLNYDDFCLNPEKGVNRLVEFLELDHKNLKISNLVNLVNAPASIGRFKQHDIRMLDKCDIDFVKKLGFTVEV